MAVAGKTKEQTRKDIITICVRKTFIRTASRVLLFQGRGRRWGRWKVLYSMSCAGEVFLSSSQNPRVIRIEERQFRDDGTVIRGKNRLVMRVPGN